MRTILLMLVLSTPALAAPAKMMVTSSAFEANSPIPEDYTCAGSDISPQLTWTNTPANAKSIAILVDDPDAPKGDVTHWLAVGLDPSNNSVPKGTALPEGASFGKNEKGDNKYMGPCPPAGAPHHYHFHVYALDTKPTATSKADFLSAIKGHILGQGELIGTYHKK